MAVSRDASPLPPSSRDHSLTRAEYPNSLRRFSKAVRRASKFRELRPALNEVVLGQDEAVEDFERRDEEDVLVADDLKPRAIARHPLSQQVLKQDSIAKVDENTPLLERTESGLVHLSTQLSNNSKRRVDDLNRRREESRADGTIDSHEATLVRIIERGDGTVAHIIVGQSTLPQTIFNSSNVLMGVGMLGLPLGVAYAGWVFGLVFLILSAILTKYTTGLLAKCLDVDSSLSNYADIAFIAFGSAGRYTTSILFAFELIAANVALVVLLAGSLGSLIPGLHEHDPGTKLLSGLILVPTCFLPLRILSYSSAVGLFAVTILLILITVAGLIKTEGPGSLHDIATTWAFPLNWRALPLSFGLIMAPWGGQSVFPNIYRDMRHPKKYSSSLKIVFSLTTSFDLLSAVIGFLMFGIDISDEITKSVLTSSGYPLPLAIVIMVMVAFIPLTKFALNNLPIVNTLEVISGIDHRVASVKPNCLARSKTITLCLRCFYRLLVCFIVIMVALVVPSFEMISAIMGAFFCFLICVILPIIFHLRMFWSRISLKRKAFDIFLVIASIILGISGTAWEFAPQEWVGFS